MKKLALGAVLAGAAVSTAGADDRISVPWHHGAHAAETHQAGHYRRPAPGWAREPPYLHDGHRGNPGRPSYDHGRHGRGHPRHEHHRRDRDNPAGEMLVGGLLGAFVGNALAGEDYGSQGALLGAVLGTAIGYGIGGD